MWPKGGTSLRISRENIDVELMLARPMSPNVYAAMAFSDDQKMGNDLVFACGRNWINKESNGVNAFWNPSIGSGSSYATFLLFYRFVHNVSFG